MSLQDVKNPHDAFFKQLMADIDVVRDFLKNYLPEKAVAALNLRKIEPVKDSFIDKELKEHLSDLIFRVKLKRGGKAYVYILFEHKSSPDKWVMWQVLLYAVSVWEVERKEKAKKLSPILPIIFYHGKAPWSYGTRFSDLIDFGGFDELREYVPDFRGILTDISHREDSEIKGKPRLRFGLLILKYAFLKELSGQFVDILKIYNSIRREAGFGFLRTALRYLIRGSKHLTEEVMNESLEKAFPEEEEELMQTLAETWMKRGKKQGLEQGRQEGLREGTASLTIKLLQKRFGAIEAETESRIRALSTAQLEELGVASLDFKSRRALTTWLHGQAK